MGFKKRQPIIVINKSGHPILKEHDSNKPRQVTSNDPVLGSFGLTLARQNPDFQDSLNLAWDAVKECTEGIVPHDQRDKIWTDLEDWPELDDEPIVREVVGWIKGAAEALNVEPGVLVTYVTVVRRP